MDLSFKIALAQMNIVPGAPARNLEAMLAMIRQAKQQKANLIAFPELSLSGYLISDAFLNESFCLDMMQYNEVLLEASDNIAIAYGNVYADHFINQRMGDNIPHPNKDGRIRKYNAAVVMQNGKYASRAKELSVLPEGNQPKTLFPNYRFFDDERYFFSLQDIAKDFNISLEELAQPFLVNIRGKQIAVGFEICEDLWCQDYRRNNAALNISKHYIKNGAELIINLSASPWTISKHRARDNRIKFLSQDCNDKFVPFLYVNNVGAQNNGKNIITFDGGTTAYNNKGEPAIISGKFFSEDLMMVSEDIYKRKGIIRKTKENIVQKFEAIKTGILHIKDMNGWDKHPRFLVGLSGGIDSATVASLLVDTVGAENVMTVNMPSRYNSSATIDAANHVADKLKVRHLDLPIEDFTTAHQKIFEKLDQKIESPEWRRRLSDENIQAKIRGTSILSNIAGRYGYMFTNNGNKLEIALGYATLYGDIGGAVAPIGDLTKTEVYAMARYMNEAVFDKQVIPDNLFVDELYHYNESRIVPSAELKTKQIDPIKYGYHCALITAFTNFLKITPEDVCQWYLNGQLEEKLDIPEALLKRWELDNPNIFIKDLEWFVSSIQKNVFKRIQAPPIIITSTSAYGFDIRESQLPVYFTKEFRELKEQVLKMTKYRKNKIQ